MPEAARVIEADPALQFIVFHTGSPRRRDAESMRLLRNGMRALAQQPNVAVKISGLGMYDRAWTTETIRPLVKETITLFGHERCMFASKFPVDALMSSYAVIWEAFDHITIGLSSEACSALFARNAEEYYRI
jgi:predicted TIM-barrel fold metal-dependent hydrolase